MAGLCLQVGVAYGSQRTIVLSPALISMTAQLTLAVEPAKFIRNKIGRASFTTVHLLEMVNYLSFTSHVSLIPDISTAHPLTAWLTTHRLT